MILYIHKLNKKYLEVLNMITFPFWIGEELYIHSSGCVFYKKNMITEINFKLLQEKMEYIYVLKIRADKLEEKNIDINEYNLTYNYDSLCEKFFIS
jgi:hypothetical protein